MTQEAPIHTAILLIPREMKSINLFLTNICAKVNATGKTDLNRLILLPASISFTLPGYAVSDIQGEYRALHVL